MQTTRRLSPLLALCLAGVACRAEPAQIPVAPATPPVASAPVPPACPAPAAPAGPRGDRYRWLAASFRKSLAALDADPAVTTRDLMNGALATLVLDGDGPRAEGLIGRVFATQSAEGAFPWTEHGGNFKDANALEFAMESLGPVLVRYRGCLRASFVDAILPQVRTSLAALGRDGPRIKPTYTNIWLLNSASLLALGNALTDQEAEALGVAQLEEWWARVGREGFFEFVSPTYYAVDVDALLLVEQYARPPRAREIARAALDVFWTEIAANWFAPRQSLVAPHSRDYDFLNGVGEIDVHTAVAGWRPTPAPEPIDLFQVALLASEAEGGYVPPERLRELAHSAAPRVVTSSWHTGQPGEQGRERYAFLTPRFAMGSTSATYPGTAQFKPMDVQLDAPPGTPTITVVTREVATGAVDDPYGVTKRADGAGHLKPVHLPMHPVAVQDRGDMLLSIVSGLPAVAPEELSTNVIFPIGLPGESVTLDGAPIEGSEPRAWPASAGAVLTVRVGGSATAIQVVSVDSCGGPATIRVQLDPTGLPHHAGRLVVRHYARQGASAWPPPQCMPRVTLVVVADAVSTDADVRALTLRARSRVVEHIERNAGGLVWSGRVKLGGVELDASRRDEPASPGHGYVLHEVARNVGGAPMRFGVLEVNGTELLAPAGHAAPTGSP